MSVATDEVVVRYLDRGAKLAAVRLRTDLLKREAPPEFERAPRSDEWTLRLPRPAAVNRMEYLLELVHRDGATELVLDPENALRASGPFGARSVLEFPEYAPPAWTLDDEAAPGDVRALRLRSRRLRAQARGLLWSPPDTDPEQPLPLLVAHDGPEYAQYALLLRLLESATAELELPPLRAALLAPVGGARDEHYSASPRYAAALARELVPALERLAPTPRRRAARVGMGASLGALAMLHAHRTHPDLFGGLFLQSGSFFRRRSDRYERGFSRFARVARFVGSVVRTESWRYPVPVAMTCGAGEENLANNRVMRDALARQGYPAVLDEHPDAHTWICWRDTLDPHLVSLLQRLWG